MICIDPSAHLSRGRGDSSTNHAFRDRTLNSDQHGVWLDTSHPQCHPTVPLRPRLPTPHPIPTILPSDPRIDDTTQRPNIDTNNDSPPPLLTPAYTHT